MQNLAGNLGCDEVIREELEEAGIAIVQHPERLKEEVPASFTGVLRHRGNGRFTFRRAWYYWVVTGPVPLDAADEMYADSVGRTDVRVAGHCGCPPPEQWADRGGDGEWYINTYHIDSQEGLNLFVATMRKHSLVT